MPNEFAYGIKPLQEVLTKNASSINKIYVRDTISNRRIYFILNKASDHRIPVTRVPESKLKELVGNVNHQGVVASISEVSYLDFEQWLDDFEPTPDKAVLCLDEIEDPHNLGAILRTAAAAGISAVIVPKHRQAPVNATVLKTSAGTAGAYSHRESC